jgi:hypothetical protein
MAEDLLVGRRSRVLRVRGRIGEDRAVEQAVSSSLPFGGA